MSSESEGSGWGATRERPLSPLPPVFLEPFDLALPVFFLPLVDLSDVTRTGPTE